MTEAPPWSMPVVGSTANLENALTDIDHVVEDNLPALKKGYRTTEFWIAVILILVAVTTDILAMLGIKFDASGSLTPLIPAILNIAGGQAAYGYAKSRGTAKASHQQSHAAVLSQAIHSKTQIVSYQVYPAMSATTSTGRHARAEVVAEAPE